MFFVLLQPLTIRQKSPENMFNKNFKLVIAVLIIGYAGYQFVEGQIMNGIALILLSAVFVFLYFRNEMILLAFLRMRKQDLDRKSVV